MSFPARGNDLRQDQREGGGRRGIGDAARMQISIRATLLRASFVVAPTFLFIYGIAHWVDGRDGAYGPGIAWVFGHVMFLLALLTFGLVMVGLHQRVSRNTTSRKLVAGLALLLGLFGVIVFARIAVIDILTGLRANDQAAMSTISSQLNAYPNAALVPFYNIGPLLFQLGMISLMLQLAILKPRQLPWWSPISLLFGFLLLGFDLNLLLPGAILVGIALIPLPLNKSTLVT
ncbi:MAG TPA: hypothetical protein VMU89_02355 [Thermomicrobiaceae bacterium]|nr:hypothetical protein [Thermomicrobiaceae bacterium]